jgi:basic membrane protein A
VRGTLVTGGATCAGRLRFLAVPRRRLGPIAVLLGVALVLAACSDDDDASDTTIEAAEEARAVLGVVFATGGLDRGLNAGMEATLGALAAEHDLEVRAFEPSEDGGDREELLELLAADGADLVVGVGAEAQAPVEEVAADHPSTAFAVIDGVEPAGANVTAVRYQDEQGAYLAGAAAALSSPGKHLAFVGAAEDDRTRALQAGFTAGALKIDEATQVDVAYLPPPGDPIDAAAATALALGQLQGGAEVAFAAPAAGAVATLAAAVEHGGTAKVVTAELVDAAALDPAAQGLVLTTIERRGSVALTALVEALVGAGVEPGLFEVGAEEEAIGFAPDALPADVTSQVEALLAQLASGEIQVPTEP